MKKNSFLKNIFILMVSQIIIKISGVIYKIYLTNKQGFGDTGNAIYSAGFQIYAILLTLSSIGVPNAISRIVSSKVAIGQEKESYRVLKIAIMIFSLIGFVCSLLLFLFAGKICTNLLQIPETKISLQLLAPSIFIVSIAAVFEGYFNGLSQINISARSQNIEQISKTILIIVIVEFIGKISNNNTTYMAAAATLATTLATIISTLYMYITFKKNKKMIWKNLIINSNQKKESIYSIMKNIILVTIPISISAFLSIATKSVDSLTIVRILKRFISSNEAKKLYGILSGKVDMLVGLPLSFNIALSTTLIPTISGLLARRKTQEIQEKIKQSMLISTIIGVPCSVLIFEFAEEILQLLFPNAIEGTLMLKISSIGIIFSMFIQTVNGVLQGIGKTRVCIKALFLGLIIKTFLNIALINIEKINVYGAIISSIISYIVTLSICVIYLKVKENIYFDLKFNLIKTLIATIIMAFISHGFYKALSNLVEIKLALIISIINGIIIYFLLIIGLRVLPIKNILKKPLVLRNYNKK